MSAIEPHLMPLLWFAVLWAVVSIGFYVLAGAFPLETRPDLRGRPLGLTVIGADILLLLVLGGSSLAYGVANLRWTSLIIVVGLGVLFAPGLYNIWPSAWRDGIAGLVIMLCALALATLGALSQFITL